MDVTHRQDLTKSGLQLVYRYTRSRHDALDSPSTRGIRAPSPLAWGRNSVRELRAQRRHVFGDGGGGSILTGSPFCLFEHDRITC